MELLLELIFGVLFEGVVDAAADAMESKKIPLWIRILLGIFLLMVMLGLIAISLVICIGCDNVFVWVLLMTVLVLLSAGLVWKIWKTFRKKSR